MKTLLYNFVAMLLLVAAGTLHAALDVQVDAPPPNAPLAAQINLGSNNIVRLTRTSFSFQRISIDPNQVVAITLKYPPAMAGQTIVVEAVDGGSVRTNSTIDGNGLLSFAYNASNLTGHARISLYDGTDTHILQFWIRDLQNPQNNPKATIGQ